MAVWGCFLVQHLVGVEKSRAMQTTWKSFPLVDCLETLGMFIRIYYFPGNFQD